MSEAPPARGSAWEVLAAFARLGVTSFGGPVAHLGYFRAELVERRRWVDEAAYADLVALCQFLPGPASSQVGIALGAVRAGYPGALAAFAGFTLPSAALLVAFARGAEALGGVRLHGLLVAAVAVVAQAVLAMGRALCPDRARVAFAVAAAVATLLAPSGAAQVAVIAAAGLLGWRLLPAPEAAPGSAMAVPVSRRAGAALLALFALLLVALPALHRALGGAALDVAARFYRAGSLVFGGGHVVLALLEREVVPRGWVTRGEFLAGYGAAQAVPGPLFSFAAYLGAVMRGAPRGVAGAALALGAVYLPSFLLVLGALPFWSHLRSVPGCQSALRGVNAAVVGVLLAALYHPVWTSAVASPRDFALAVVAFALLEFARWSPLRVVLLCAAAGALVDPAPSLFVQSAPGR